MFIWNASLLVIIVRTSIVYFVFLIGLRLLGARPLGQSTVVELALLLLISNSVQNAMVGTDTSITGGIIAAVTLLLLNAGIAWLSENSPVIRRLTSGEPVPLAQNGKIIIQNCARCLIETEMLDAAAREHGLPDHRAVKSAVLEIDGSISVIGNDSAVISISSSTIDSHRHHRRIRGRPRR